MKRGGIDILFMYYTCIMQYALFVKTGVLYQKLPKMMSEKNRKKIKRGDGNL